MLFFACLWEIPLCVVELLFCLFEARLGPHIDNLIFYASHVILVSDSRGSKFGVGLGAGLSFHP